MAIKVQSTKGISSNGIKCLVYGKGGIGKTTLMGTSPKPIIISNEGGLLALKDIDIPYIEVKNLEDVENALDYVKTRKARKEFKTVCLDSISEIAEVILGEEIKKEKDPRKAYNTLYSEVSGLVRDFRDLRRRNVVFSAKRKRVADADSGFTQYIASMPGKALLEFLPYQFDEVFYFDLHEKDNGKLIRVLRTEAGFEHDAKDRSGTLNSMERPNLTRIFRKISGNKSKTGAK